MEHRPSSHMSKIIDKEFKYDLNKPCILPYVLGTTLCLRFIEVVPKLFINYF